MTTKRHPAPGRADREGTSLIELANLFPTEAAARRWFEAQMWPNERCCGHCGSPSDPSGAEGEAHAVLVHGLPELLLGPHGVRCSSAAAFRSGSGRSRSTSTWSTSRVSPR